MDETSLLTLQNEIAKLEQELDVKKHLLAELQSASMDKATDILLLQEENLKNTVNNHSSPEAKIALFRSLFKGREDVYAKLMKLRFMFDFNVWL